MRNASDETNAELLDRARRGEGRAFEDLARAVERPLYRHALRMLANASDAEDVVQDALLSAWKSLSSFEGASFRAWIRSEERRVGKACRAGGWPASGDEGGTVARAAAWCTPA